jgi:hypothetical protein
MLGEAVFAQADPGFVQGFAAGSPANSREAIPTLMWGFYAQASLRFAIDALNTRLPADLRDTTFTVALRYDGKDTDAHRDSAAGDARRVTLGLNVRPATAYVLKTEFAAEAHGVDATAGAPEAWQGAFWKSHTRRFLASVAFLF